METKNIYLRKVLEGRILRFHVRRFFKHTSFPSEYIFLQTKLGAIKNDAYLYNLGKNIILNVKNEGEITNYIEFLTFQYNLLVTNESKENIEKISKVSFSFVPASRNDYVNFISELPHNNPFEY